MSGVIRSERVRNRIAHLPVRWMSSVTTLGSSAPVERSQTIQIAGRNSPANTAAFSGANRPLRSVQGAFHRIMAGFFSRGVRGSYDAETALFQALARGPG